MLALAGWLLIVLALCGAIYMLASIPAVRRFLKTPLPPLTSFPAVTLLKPLSGAEPGLADNLASFCKQDYPGAVQILAGVQSKSDPAIAIVEALKRAYPRVEMTLVIYPRRSGSNPKIANLMNMMGSARHDVLVLTDSDIGVTPGYLRSVVSALEQDRVGVVSCCYLGKALDNPWSKLLAMGIDYQLLPGAIFGLRHGLAVPCFGPTIAIRKQTLAELGGFEAFRDVLADDYELGRAARDHGYRVAFPPAVVLHTCTETGAGEYFRHELRWARTIRLVEPRAYFASAIAHAVPLAVMGVILTGFSPSAIAALAVVAGIRLLQKDQLDRAFGVQGFPVWLLFLRDMVSFAVFVSSYFTRRVDWRGDKYRIDLEGAMTHE